LEAEELYKKGSDKKGVERCQKLMKSTSKLGS